LFLRQWLIDESESFLIIASVTDAEHLPVVCVLE